MDSISSTSQALLSAQTRLDAAAGKMAGASANALSSQAVVDLTSAKQQFAVAVAATRTADKRWESLLDILA